MVDKSVLFNSTISKYFSKSAASGFWVLEFGFKTLSKIISRKLFFV